ncbi:MAG: hypothetical protein Q7R39_01815 [Dehalococcoidia bacterium]|nr:hypothetical protein [Dehalococcoidia bacterium]
MIIKGDRTTQTPFVVISDGSTIASRRVPLTEKKFDESWIQSVIERNPNILPVSEIEPAFAPLISIGKEVSTKAGAIDNLFLSAEGYITLVENKLWRNSKARREVVGQIIDYAAELSRWKIDDLERQIKDYNKVFRHANMGLLETIRMIGTIGDNDESSIRDSISRNLKRGRFLLLIVGDGIHEDVEAMVDYLNQTPQLHFTLALVEMRVYEMKTGNDCWHLVIPQLVTRTREIERAIVRVEGSSIVVTVPPDPPLGASDRRRILTEQDFLDILKRHATEEEVEFAIEVRNDMANRENAKIDWKASSYVVKLPDPGGSRQDLTLFVVWTDGTVSMEWLADQMARIGLRREIGLDFVKNTAALFDNCSLALRSDQVLSRSIRLMELKEKYDDFAGLVHQTIEKIRQSSRERR